MAISARIIAKSASYLPEAYHQFSTLFWCGLEGLKISHLQAGKSQANGGDAVHLILEGFACRYKVLPTGERSIFAYLIPGDTCDWHVFILKRMDHSIGTLSA